MVKNCSGSSLKSCFMLRKLRSALIIKMWAWFSIKIALNLYTDETSKRNSLIILNLFTTGIRTKMP